MRILFIFFIISYTSVFAQFQAGLNTGEVKDMVMICNSFTYLEEYGNDDKMIPAGYKKVYMSPVLGMDNKFQVFRKGKVGVVNFRGSTNKKISWMENCYSAMISSSGEIRIGDQKHTYKFSDNPEAHVHSGYVLALMYLKQDLIKQIKALNNQGVYHIIITGHSQGGSLAMMTRALLEFESKVSTKNQFKVYTFAQPMVGNSAFISEYNKKYCDTDLSYSFINPGDAVPSMPMSFNDSTYWKQNFEDLISKDREFDAKEMVKDGASILFKRRIRKTSTWFSSSVNKQIKKELGEIEMPQPTGDINFAQVGNIIEIDPPAYPLVLKDSTVLQDTAFLARYPRDENGIFLNKNVYKKVTMMQHHKTYNYYTGVLKKYFPKEYEAIEPKVYLGSQED